MADATSNDADESVDAVEATDPEPSRSTGSKRRVTPWPEPPAAAAHEAAPRLTSQLIGLTADAACRRVRERNPNILLRIVGPNDGYPADFKEGRITLHIRNGRVVDAVAD